MKLLSSDAEPDGSCSFWISVTQPCCDQPSIGVYVFTHSTFATEVELCEEHKHRIDATIRNQYAQQRYAAKAATR